MLQELPREEKEIGREGGVPNPTRRLGCVDSLEGDLETKRLRPILLVKIGSLLNVCLGIQHYRFF